MGPRSEVDEVEVIRKWADQFGFVKPYSSTVFCVVAVVRQRIRAFRFRIGSDERIGRRRSRRGRFLHPTRSGVRPNLYLRPLSGRTSREPPAKGETRDGQRSQLHHELERVVSRTTAMSCHAIQNLRIDFATKPS
jgi:hypothetical protein